jgi:hypothetical protein
MVSEESPESNDHAGYSDHIEETDRKRGILSRSDREYFLNEGEDIAPASQSERNVRSRIRNRIVNALLDAYLIDEHLEDRDLEQVSDRLDTEMVEAIHGLLALLLRLAEETNSEFEDWLEGGFTHKRLPDDGMILEQPTVTLNVQEPTVINPEVVMEKFNRGEYQMLSEGEMHFLLWRLGQMVDSIDTPDESLIDALSAYADRIEDETILGDIPQDETLEE